MSCGRGRHAGPEVTRPGTTMGRGGKKEKNLNELKQELEIDVHKVDVDVLCKRFNTNVEQGLTDAAAAAGLAQYGKNELTPPPTTPEWVSFLIALISIQALLCAHVFKNRGITQSFFSLQVKFCQCLFSGFACLLWLGAVLCFLAYSIQVLLLDNLQFHKNNDNSQVFTVMCISFDRLVSDKDRKVVQPT